MDVLLKCRCGTISGIAHDVSPTSGLRLICHCNDCQTFARHIDNDGDTLDEFGAVDVYQMPMSRIKINSGSQHMKCLRLKPKGLIRWYAGCCNTPIGATSSASIPTIGISHNFMVLNGDRDQVVGPAKNFMFCGEGLPIERRRSSTFRIIVKILMKMFFWKIRGLNTPTAFFDENGHPISEPTILNK